MTTERAGSSSRQGQAIEINKDASTLKTKTIDISVSACRATQRPRVINMKYSKIYIDFVCIALHYVITMDYCVNLCVGLIAPELLIFFSFSFFSRGPRVTGRRISHFQTVDNSGSREPSFCRRGGASEPGGSPLSRWRCVRRPEAIRPTLILHLLSSVTVPHPETRKPPQPRKPPVKKSPGRSL